MSSPFKIVKDSSIWYNSASLKAAHQLDTVLYTGVVKSVTNTPESDELRYLVEVMFRGDIIPTSCRMLRRFGGVFNYEDVVLRGYSYNAPTALSAKAGDVVLVGMIGGQGREGVILGGLTHPTRKNLKSDTGPEYRSEFNGIETYINKDGEFTQTFKGQPTNLADLDKTPQSAVPAPKYDEDVGTSFMKWDKTGSFILGDNAKSNPQKFFVDKKNGTIDLASGKVSLKLDKNKQSAVLTAKDIRLGSDAATEQAVFGTTYRQKETQMHADLQAELLQMGTFLLTASADPIFLGLVPGAAIAIGNAAQKAFAMAKAIATFEAGSATYLSNVVKVG